MGAWREIGLGGLVLLATLAPPTTGLRAQERKLTSLVRDATPLVLKDGRIAKLSAHAVPFEVGADRLDEAVAGALARLARRAATDCFLTAQAIGHVVPGTPGDGDTLAAHRIARARAEHVQALLIEKGLPASAIAAVWDWQFAVREPRVTLWLFRLPEGEGCEGKRLPAGTPVAAKPPVPPEAREQPIPTLPAPVPPPEPPGPIAALPPASLALISPEAGGEPVAAAEIVFEQNSSFFPRGASRELQKLVEALPRGRAYEFEILAAVSADEAAAADPEQDDPERAARYHRWLAERRVGRVRAWIEQHAEIRELALRPGYLEGDPSRRVVVKVRELAPGPSTGG